MNTLDERPVLHEGQLRGEVAQQRVDVRVFRVVAGLRFVGIEVAIRALAHAPRQMDVQRKRRQRGRNSA